MRRRSKLPFWVTLVGTCLLAALGSSINMQDIEASMQGLTR